MRNEDASWTQEYAEGRVRSAYKFSPPGFLLTREAWETGRQNEPSAPPWESLLALLAQSECADLLFEDDPAR